MMRRSLLVVGIAMALYAVFVFDPSIAGAPNQYSSLLPPDRIINIGLQQRQMMIFLAGVAVALAGVIVTVAAWITEKIDAMARAMRSHQDG